MAQGYGESWADKSEIKSLFKSLEEEDPPIIHMPITEYVFTH